MRENAIGVFDSGLGGLTAMKELCRLLPREDIVYFGDTSRVPYGTRSPDTIIRYARQDLNFLSEFHVKAALVACGTISAVALDKVKSDYPFPVIGVIDSAARAAALCSENGRIGIIGTPATIKSGAYEKILHEIAPQCDTMSIACPLFVPLVENGHIEKNDPLIVNAIELYLSRLLPFHADTVILGCTHYPIIAHTIGDYVGRDVRLINPGREAAKTVRDMLAARGLLSEREAGSHRYFVSDSIENFETLGGIFMRRSINGEVHKIDIEKY